MSIWTSTNISSHSPPEAVAPGLSSQRGASLVSIVTISKDDPTGLEATVRSVMSQSFTEYELILVRSGKSKQADLPVDARIVVVDETARGISAAFNTGIARASGNWISFLNGGDQFIAADSLHLLTAGRNAGVKMVFSFARVDGHTFTIPRRALRYGKDTFLYASHQASLFHRGLFAEFGGFSDRLLIRMDLDWLSRLPSATPYAFVETATVRFDATGVSASNVVRSSIEEVKILWRSAKTRHLAVEVALLRLPFRVLRRIWRRLL